MERKGEYIMVSWMVHLRIADKLMDKIGNLDACAFILGNLAPDSGVPNEDWSVFTPPTNVSHFKSKVDGKAGIQTVGQLVLLIMSKISELLP